MQVAEQILCHLDLK